MFNRREFVHRALGSTAFLVADGLHPLSRVLGANDRVRFGLIGCGGRGQEIFKAAMKAPNTEAVAVADDARAMADAASIAAQTRLAGRDDFTGCPFFVRVGWITLRASAGGCRWSSSCTASSGRSRCSRSIRRTASHSMPRR